MPVAALYVVDGLVRSLIRHMRCSGVAAEAPATGVIAWQPMRLAERGRAACALAIPWAASRPRKTCKLPTFTVVPVAADEGVRVMVLLGSPAIAKRQEFRWLLLVLQSP